MTGHWTQGALIPRARRGDPSTSHEAAASVAHVRESQRLLLDVLANLGPSTDEGIALAAAAISWPISPSGLRTRRHELVELGLVYPTGEERRLVTGRWAKVWAVVEP